MKNIIKQLLIKLQDRRTRKYEEGCIKKYLNTLHGRPDERETFFKELIEEVETGEIAYWERNYKFYEFSPGNSIPRKRS